MRLQWMLPAMLQLTLVHSALAAPAPEWSVDPAVPGADVPEQGASLFDMATTLNGRQVIPFPFEKMIAGLEAAAGCEARPACTRAILLPLGRSLQRVAASPDFFAHPRVVAAFVADGRGPLQFKDRLYLGYQDKAGVIEVISYNEGLGRFEFQVVRDYRAGGVPRVSHARRVVCVSCHQNQGPIFSRQVWLETSANPRIAERLAEQSASFHGVPARGTVDAANAIDDATDRANRFAVVQQLWRYGCGEGAVGAACRRGAFVAALQFALTNGRAYEKGSEFRRSVIATLQSNANVRWPSGLAVPDADLVNRDPFAGAMDGAQDPLALVHVAARFDPLVPRAPMEVIQPDGDAMADELVRGTAGFISPAQIEELDAALLRDFEHPAQDVDSHAEGGRTSRIDASCSVDEAEGRITFDCPAQASSAQPSGEAIVLRGVLRERDGDIDEIALSAEEVVRHLQVHSMRRERHAGSSTASFQVRDGGRVARLPDGNAVSAIVVSWRGRGSGLANGTASLRIREDFASVAGMAEPHSRTVGSAMMDEFIARVRGVTPRRCCGDPKVPKSVMGAEPASEVTSPALPFEPDCGNCHHTDDVAPPNFLTGDATRVDAALNSCAPRIYVRLAMRDVPAAERDKSPMPPEPVTIQQASGNHEHSGAVGGKSASLAAARRAIEERIAKRYGRVPTVDELLRGGYEHLPPCLPASI